MPDGTLVLSERRLVECSALASCGECALELLDADDTLRASRRWGT
jgi:hypothetical protein